MIPNSLFQLKCTIIMFWFVSRNSFHLNRTLNAKKPKRILLVSLRLFNSLINLISNFQFPMKYTARKESKLEVSVFFICERQHKQNSDDSLENHNNMQNETEIKKYSVEEV